MRAFQSTSRGRWIRATGLLLLFLGALFAWAMHRDLNHDEHQFLAPGSLLARDGLLPFRDYPLFHLPNLTLVYGALDRLFGYPIFSAKLLSVVSSWVVGLLLVLQCHRTPPFGEQRWAFAGAAIALGFLFFDPLFSDASGKTWNHEFPTALAIIATVLVVMAVQRFHLGLAMAAGISAGLAVGTRLTFAPLLIPLGVALLLFSQGTLRRKGLFGASFAFGAFVALLPSLYLFQADREAFLFGNLEFPRLRLLDPENTRIHKTVTWWRKMRFFFKEVFVPSWPLFTAFLLIAVGPALRGLRLRQPARLGSTIVLLTLPFLIAGCFAPSRYQYQHYFVVIPFLVLGIVYGAGERQRNAEGRRQNDAGRLPLAALVLVISSLACYTYHTFKKNGRGLEWVAESVQPSKWFALKAHASAVEIRALVEPGKILTLAPAWVTEAGLPIYPEFASGPFAWRSAHLMTPERRKRLKMVAPEDLETFLASDPPAAILTGIEDKKLEEPLVEYAKLHGYRLEKLGRKKELWVRE